MIPAAAVTTTVTVLRPASNVDPYGVQPAPATVATAVNAHLSGGGGSGDESGGDQQIVARRLGCDPCDLKHYDQVRDDATLLVYDVVAVVDRRGGPLYGALDHIEADLRLVQGEAAE